MREGVSERSRGGRGQMKDERSRHTGRDEGEGEGGGWWSVSAVCSLRLAGHHAGDLGVIRWGQWSALRGDAKGQTRRNFSLGRVHSALRDHGGKEASAVRGDPGPAVLSAGSKREERKEKKRRGRRMCISASAKTVMERAVRGKQVDEMVGG